MQFNSIKCYDLPRAAGARWCTAILLVASQVWAEAQAQETSDWDVSLGAALGYMDYRESAASGGRLNRETGLLPGIAGQIGYQTGRWRYQLSANYFAADVDYRGRTNTGRTVDSQTDTAIWEVGAQLAHQLTADAMGLSLQAGLGWRRWERNIQSVPTALGIDETYDWPHLHVGVSGQWPLASGGLQWTLRVQQPIDSRLEARFLNDLDRAKLEPEARLGARAALAWQHNLSGGRALVLQAWYDYWEFAASEPEVLTQGGIPVGTVQEPASKTRFVGVTLAFRGWD